MVKNDEKRWKTMELGPNSHLKGLFPVFALRQSPLGRHRHPAEDAAAHLVADELRRVEGVVPPEMALEAQIMLNPSVSPRFRTGVDS